MITFQHQSEVRQIIYGEFDLETAIEILRQAQRELDAVTLDEEEFDSASWNYCRDLRRAECVTIYGAEPEE